MQWRINHKTMNQMKKLAWILLTVLCLPFLNAQVKNTTNNQNKPNNEVQIQRNIEFPRVHVFDPSAVPDVWVEPERENHEVMPEPGTINHPLRKKIDANRDAAQKRSADCNGADSDFDLWSRAGNRCGNGSDCCAFPCPGEHRLWSEKRI